MIKEPPLHALKEADSQALKKIYLSYRVPFLNFARKYQLSDSEILDIYQDAIIALRENIINGKIELLSSSLKTYLFSIGKYKVYSRLRELNKMSVIEDYKTANEEEENFDFEINTSLTEQQVLLKEGLENLGEKCRVILELFYYRGLTIDEIRISQKYQNNNTVKSQKSRCLKTLKEMILNK